MRIQLILIVLGLAVVDGFRVTRIRSIEIGRRKIGRLPLRRVCEQEFEEQEDSRVSKINVVGQSVALLGAYFLHIGVLSQFSLPLPLAVNVGKGVVLRSIGLESAVGALVLAVFLVRRKNSGQIFKPWAVPDDFHGKVLQDFYFVSQHKLMRASRQFL